MNVNLIYAELRPSQTAVVHDNLDGSYTILVNSNKPHDKQLKGILHEIAHVRNDDFYSEVQADIIERLAHARKGTSVMDEINFFSCMV